MKREQIVAYSLKYQGEHHLIKRALCRNERYTSPDMHDAYLTILDADYPELLRRLSDPPYVLYTKGNVDLLRKPSISIIGSRLMSEYAKRSTEHLVKHLKDTHVIVSGLALGVDGCAHQSALFMGGETIAILAFGLSHMYPKGHESLKETIAQKGLLLSEYPVASSVEKHRFVARNRIIAGLSDKLCVMQAGLKSGTMSTVNMALDCGSDVYCLPYHFDEIEGEGNNLLIQQGAFILTNPNELIKL